MEHPKVCMLAVVIIGLMTTCIAMPTPGYTHEISRPIDNYPINKRHSVPSACNKTSQPYEDCSTNFTTLERALFETCGNHYRILTAFYPPRESVALYIDVYYRFLPNETHNDTFEQHWIWTSGSFYLIQPPAVFRFTSLFFSYPEGHIHNLSITLPGECRNLSALQNVTGEDGLGMLEVLTHRLKLYAEYNSLDQIITGAYEDINRFLGKAVSDNHELHHIYQEGSLDKGRYEIIIFFVLTLALPFFSIAFLIILARGSRVQLRNKLTDPNWHPTIAALIAIGLLFTTFVVIMDWCAVVWAYDRDQYNEFKHNPHAKRYVGFAFIIVTAAVDTCAFFYSFSFVMFYLGARCCNSMSAGCCYTWCAGRITTCARCCNAWCVKKRSSCFACCFVAIFCGKAIKGRQEVIMWWLTTITVASMVCFSNHIGYMVLGWIVYPKRGGAVLVIYILSFFYYFVVLKHIYLSSQDRNAPWNSWACRKKQLAARSAGGAAWNAVVAAFNAVVAALNAVEAARNAVVAARNAVEAARNAVGAARNAVGVAPNTDEAAPSAVESEPLCNAVGAARNVVEADPNAVKAARNANETARNANEAARNAIEAARNAVEAASNAVEAARNAVEAAPNATLNADEAALNADEAAVAARNAVEAARNAIEEAPNAVESEPLRNAVEAARNAVKAARNAVEAARNVEPTAVEAARNVNEAARNAKEAARNAKEAARNANEAAHNANEAAHNTDRNANEAARISVVMEMKCVLSPEEELQELNSRYATENAIEHEFSFCGLLTVIIFGFLLGGIEVVAILAFTELPLIGVIEDTPTYMLNLFHVSVLVASIVLTYKYLTAEPPVEKELLKGIVNNLMYYRNTTTEKRENDKPQPPPQQPPPPPQQVKKPRQVTEVEKAAAVLAAIGYNTLQPPTVQPPPGPPVKIEELHFLQKE